MSIEVKNYEFDVITTMINDIINKRSLKDPINFPSIKYQMRQVIDKLIVHFYKENIGKEQEESVKSPKSWKDMFKEAHKDNWFVKKWLKKRPIQYNTTIIRKITVFPEVKMPNRKEFETKYEFYEVVGK